VDDQADGTFLNHLGDDEHLIASAEGVEHFLNHLGDDELELS